MNNPSLYGQVVTVTNPAASGAQGATIRTYFGYTSDPAYSYTQAARIGQPIAVTDNLGKTTHLRYDARGNAVIAIDALGNETDQTYNLANQPWVTTLPATDQTGTGHSTRANTYPYTGGPLKSVALADESGNVVRQAGTTYGPEGETLGVSGSTEPVTYAYGAAYRLQAMTDGGGHTTHYFYDFAGYLDSLTYPGYSGPTPAYNAATGQWDNITGGDSVRFPSHDADGHVLARVDGRGVVTSYTYNDPESRLTNIHYSNLPASVAAIPDVSIRYDQYGRTTTLGNGVTQDAYGYASGTLYPGYDDNDAPLNVQTTYYASDGVTALFSKALAYGYYPTAAAAACPRPPVSSPTATTATVA